MKINWKLRFKNKTTLCTLILAIITFVYQILQIFEIAVPVSEDALSQIIMLIVNVLVMAGIVVDPTTSGISDSDTAMEYKEPK